MIDFKEDRYRLTIPLPDAIGLALGGRILVFQAFA